MVIFASNVEIGDEDSRVHAHIAGTSAPVFSGEPSASQGCGKNGSVIKVKVSFYFQSYYNSFGWMYIFVMDNTV